jgi:hypothetical protein
MTLNNNRIVDSIGKALLVIMLAVLALFVFAQIFFPKVLPSAEKDPTLDPTFSLSSGNSNSAVTTQEKFPADMTLQRYTNTRHGFSFQYPENWSIESASKEEEYFQVVAWVYTPEQTAALKKCKALHSSKDWLLYCGPAMADSVMGLYADGVIQYDQLEDFEKGNYPNYQKLTIGNLDVFQFTQRNDFNDVGFHVNHPRGTFGVSFLLHNTNDENIHTTRQILSTFAFTQ